MTSSSIRSTRRILSFEPEVRDDVWLEVEELVGGAMVMSSLQHRTERTHAAVAQAESHQYDGIVDRTGKRLRRTSERARALRKEAKSLIDRASWGTALAFEMSWQFYSQAASSLRPASQAGGFTCSRLATPRRRAKRHWPQTYPDYRFERLRGVQRCLPCVVPRRWYMNRRDPQGLFKL